MSEAETNIAFGLVMKYFGGDINKALAWWASDNPLLGGVSPGYMVSMGRESKLLKFIKGQVSGGAPKGAEEYEEKQPSR